MDTKDNGETALIHASSNGNLDIVKSLLEQGLDINVKDSNNETALILACIYGHFDIVKYLVEQEADINHSDIYGNTPLMHASRSYQNDDYRSKCGYYSGRDLLGRQHIEIIQYLLEQGAHLNAKDKNGQTALDIAKKWHLHDIIGYFESIQK